MLPVSSISFKGQVSRQIVTGFKESHDKNPYTYETTYDKFIKSYDSQIEKIQNRKNFAIKLDNMMHNDPDIKAIIDKLPDDIEIEVAGNFTAQEIDTDREIELANPVLLASHSQFTKTQKGQSLDMISLIHYLTLEVEYSKEGPDKKIITDWLNDLTTFFS